jgi:hypothetical protein
MRQEKHPRKSTRKSESQPEHKEHDSGAISYIRHHKFRSGLLVVLLLSLGAPMNYFGNNPRILYFPAIIICLVILYFTHAYLSSKELPPQTVANPLSVTNKLDKQPSAPLETPTPTPMKKDDKPSQNIITTGQSGGQNIVAGRDVNIGPTPPPKRPRFTENASILKILIGTNTMVIRADSIKKGGTARNVFNFRGMQPFSARVSEDRELMVDAVLYAGPGRPPVQLKENDLTNRPHDWDWNSDEHAMELVDETGAVVFNIEYLDEKTASIKGVFVYGINVLSCEDNGVMEVGVVKELEPDRRWSIRPIFKYPSKDFKGQRVKP